MPARRRHHHEYRLKNTHRTRKALHPRKTETPKVPGVAGTPSGNTTINAQIKSYRKQNGTVVDLSSDPKNNVFFDTDVVSVTFQLKVISVDTNAVWASGVAYLFG
jgi:hypothetical protein